MIKVSVITPSIRKEGLEIVEKALNRQTFKDFEWIIGAPFKYEVSPKFKNFTRNAVDNFEGGYWTLNRIYNKLISHADGELIVSWQDYTFADPDALAKFYAHYQREPTILVSAVGNKYQQVYPYPMLKTWQDPRERDDQGSYYFCNFNDIEWNLCSVPKKALYDIGGFDSRMDFLGYGMDGYGVNERILDYGGYDFKIDQTIKSYSLGHERTEGWEKDNLIHGGYLMRKAQLIDEGKWPVLQYLADSPRSEKEGGSQ